MLNVKNYKSFFIGKDGNKDYTVLNNNSDKLTFPNKTALLFWLCKNI